MLACLLLRRGREGYPRLMRAGLRAGVIAAVACAVAVVAAAGASSSRRTAAAVPHGAVPPWPSARPRELATGVFLVARPHAGGPYFQESVVLLLEYGPGGTVGLIINRPTRFELAEVIPEAAALEGRSDPVFLGGPVEKSRVMLLIQASEPPPHSQPVTGDIHVSGSIEALRAIAESVDPSLRVRAYVGYAGWAPGQLEGELARGDWNIAPAESRAVFEMESEKVWRELIDRTTGLQANTETRAPADAS